MTPTPEGKDEVQRFAGWEIRPQDRLLLVRGQEAKVGSRAFDVLLALLRRAGRVVRKAELLDAAWAGLVVEENNLSVQISALRKLLGPDTIVTVAGIGYRLAAAPLPPGVPGLANGRADAGLRTPELVGRDADLATLLPRLGQVPLLSIVGTGGVGKTALARALLARTSNAWRDGVHWIDLAPLQPGVPLLPLVARALGVLPDGDAVASGDVMRSLSKLQALIALDNCEHLLAAVTDCVAPLLRGAPGLHWLATSQAPLRVAGEEVYRLAPLDVAPPGADAEQSVGCSAMTLLVLRARAADRHFELQGDSVDVAVDICRALDGLPLALEMAAARVATLGLHAVREQLQRRLDLRSGRRDAPERHHSLRDTFAWSYGLLSARQQRLFLQLQPFQGGFTASMVQQAAAPQADDPPAQDDGSAIDTLRALLDKSLVQRMADAAHGAPQRYMLLESARDFAAQQLETVVETDAVRRRHAHAVADAFDSAWDELLQSRDAEWWARYLPERGNVAAALAWACARGERGEPALLARLVAACALLDNFSDTESELVTVAVPLDLLRQAPPPLRARACLELGWAFFLQGSRELGTGLLELALQDCEANDDQVGIYLSLTRLIRLYRGRPGLQPSAQALWTRLSQVDASRMPLRLRLYCESTVARHFGAGSTLERLQQIGRIAQQAGFEIQAATCQTNITDQLLLQGRFAEAVAVADEVLAHQPARLRALAWVCHNQAHALVQLGRLDEARTAAQRMLRAAPSQAHMVMDLFALVAARQARWDDAALMAGRSARIKRERDLRPDPAEAALIDETMQALRAALAPADLERLFELGAAMASANVLAVAELA